MEKFKGGEETLLAQEQIFNYDPEDELLRIEYIDQLDDVSLFVNGIKTRLIKIGHDDIPEDPVKLTAIVVKYCSEAGVHISRQTLANWFTSGAPSTSKAGRENIYQLSCDDGQRNAGNSPFRRI